MSSRSGSTLSASSMATTTEKKRYPWQTWVSFDWFESLSQSSKLQLSTFYTVLKHLETSTILPLNSRQLLLKRELKLDNGDSYLFQAAHDNHKSSCTELYLQVGVQNEANNVFTDLTVQIMNEPCYNVLRTQEQLGYIVFCGPRKNCGAQGVRIIVQSNRHPAYVEERIENFLKVMRQQLENMSLEEFERHKSALAALKLEKPKRLSAQFSRYLNEISLQQYHFARAESETNLLKTVTKPQFMEFFDVSRLVLVSFFFEHFQLCTVCNEIYVVCNQLYVICNQFYIFSPEIHSTRLWSKKVPYNLHNFIWVSWATPKEVRRQIIWLVCHKNSWDSWLGHIQIQQRAVP